MIQVLNKSKCGNVTLEIETVFIVRGGGVTMQYHEPTAAVFEFGTRAVSQGTGKHISQQTKECHNLDTKEIKQ